MALNYDQAWAVQKMLTELQANYVTRTRLQQVLKADYGSVPAEADRVRSRYLRQDMPDVPDTLSHDEVVLIAGHRAAKADSRMLEIISRLACEPFNVTVKYQ